MLSIGKLGGGGKTERYYTNAVARGREDYYSGKGEAPGRWAGAAAGDLELTGEVDADDLGFLLRGQKPIGGTLRAIPEKDAVSGFDLTFRAPKSVSILFGIGDERVVAAARDAHDAAVIEALAYMERAACRARRGRGGVQRVRGRGFVAAAFRHRTSRAGDPQLHTHVVIGNLTEGPDGRWTALDGRLLYRHAKTAGYLYQAALRAQLTQTLGVHWTEVVKGSAEIAGIPRSLIDHFSQRRAEIVELMKRRGEHSARAAQVATLETRRRKDYDVPVDRLREEWRRRALEQGFDPERLAELLDRTEMFPAERLALARAAADLGGIAGLSRESSTFDRRDVLQAWAERHQQGATVADIERLADAWLASPAALRLDAQAADPECPLYSTPEMLAVEHELVAASEARGGAGVAVVPDDRLKETLAARGDLSDEQANLVKKLTTSGDGVEVVRAAAGTGKTYALDAARAAWQAADHPVVGCALSARAAAELRDQSGIETLTIARLLRDLDHGYALAPGSVLVVDEAGMVGTRAVAEIARHAGHASAKLVLVGDDRQLPEIQAGGAFRGLAARLGATELREVRRQREEWDRTALNALREGDVRSWAQEYRERGRLTGAPDPEAVRAALISDWWRAHREAPSETSVMIALRRVDVADLNERARACLRAAGRLGPEELELGRAAYSTGDRVVAERNDRRLGLTNGTMATVTAVGVEQKRLTVRTDRGTEIEVDTSYLADGHLAYAYALTAHKAQGMTVDRAFVLGSDELYREWGYTALSRHREEARFYVTAPADQPALPGLEPPGDPMADELDRTLGRSRAKEMALDTHAREKPLSPAEIARRVQEAEQFQRSVRSLRADRAEEPASRPDGAVAEVAAAEARLAETEKRRDALPFWRRRDREILNRQIDSQLRAVDHWRSVVAEPRAEGSPAARLQTRAADQPELVELLDRPAVAEPALDLPETELDLGL